MLLEPRDSVALLNFSMSFSPDYRALLSVSSFLFPVQLVKRAKRNSPLFDGYPIKASKINARNQPRLRRVPAREKIMVVILNRRSSVDLVGRGGKHEGKREFPTGFGEISTSET